MHHHDVKPLFSTEEGTVLQCRSCGWISVFFGSLILTQRPDGFNELKQMIDQLEPIQHPGMERNPRPYMMRTKNEQIGLAFTEDEIQELRELLAGAQAMQELDHLLKSALQPDRSGDPQ